MPRSVSTIGALLLGAVLATAGYAEDRHPRMTLAELPCSFCHVCERPTPTYLCLRACPRTSAAAIAKEMAQKHPPDTVLLDDLEHLYLPVPFDHKGHAEMADMTDGCAVCHHYTAAGTEHPACKTCHETSPQREDMRKPSLKAAYHRQCMNCHRDWSRGTECAACHAPKIGQNQEIPSADGLLSKMHPPIPEPGTITYEPQSRPIAGAKITFRHKDHINRFGLKCAECHREDSCSRCHEKPEEGVAGAAEPKMPREAHRICSTCHDVENKDACDRCHWKEGGTPPKPFEHTATEWPLGRYHAEVGCRTCHQTVPFQKLNRDCNACHSVWQPANFDHAVTGQALDTNHADIDCIDCHAKRKFDSPPRCDECHDESEGIAFPAKLPGQAIIRGRRAGDRSSGHQGTRID